MKKFDMFSQPIRLSLNRSYYISTTFGGYLSLITFLGMALYVWFTGNYIFFKKVPRIYQENLMKRRAINFTLTKNDTPIFFQVLNVDDKAAFIDLTVLKVKLKLKNYNNSKLASELEFELETCKEDYIDPKQYEDNIELFKLLKQREYFCPQIGSGINLYGSWIDKNSTLLQILVYPCNNATDRVICKSREEKDLFKLYLPIALSNYDDPFSFNLKEDYYYLPRIDAYEFYTYEVEEIYVKTDYGFLLSRYEAANANNFALKSFGRRDYKVHDPYFFSIDIQSSFNQVYYARVYVTLSDILSYVGVMYANIGPLVVFLAGLFIELERSKIMLKNFFVFKNPNEQDNDYAGSRVSCDYSDF